MTRPKKHVFKKHTQQKTNPNIKTGQKVDNSAQNQAFYIEIRFSFYKDILFSKEKIQFKFILSINYTTHSNRLSY